ncbi:MAG: DNA-processing protein DprA [Actinobacteria bacterium]|nr:DNA-processing protein DprA [Actinomycetota bacterium]
MNIETLRAEPSAIRLLERIDGASGGASHGGSSDGDHPEMTQRRADGMLARIAWSRITEPGDGVAGVLVSSLGPQSALGLLVQRADVSCIRRALAAALGDASAVPAERVLADALERWYPRLDRSETLRDIEGAAAAKLRVVLPGDRAWPDGVSDLGVHAPNMLWVRGNLDALGAYSLGVVGARAATGYGSHVTAELVDGACRAGLAVVSGAAYGIDAVAHRTALAAGAVTVAVVAGGADRPYPRAHESLLERIAGGGPNDGDVNTGGAVCSEMVPGAAPTRWRFLQRNRLIAALSRAILVTEAGVNSGSLNTAGHASQLGRPIGAVPGPVTSAASAGCHKLIRDYDAALITSVREACELAGMDEMLALFMAAGIDDSGNTGDTVGASQAPESRESAWARRVCDALPLRGARGPAAIAKLSGLTPEQVRGVLSELELLGKVRRREREGMGGEQETQWSLVKSE